MKRKVKTTALLEAMQVTLRMRNRLVEKRSASKRVLKRIDALADRLEKSILKETAPKG
ncbi:MAG: hypothetical protein AAGI92_02500 [Pseudomonadota bacterium]